MPKGLSLKIKTRRSMDIRQAFSLGELSARWGVSRQAALDYIKNNKRYDKWLARRQQKLTYEREQKIQERKHLEEESIKRVQLLERLVGDIALFSIKKMPEQYKEAQARTLLAQSSYQKTSPPDYTEIFEIFKMYTQAKKQGVKISLSQARKALDSRRFPVDSYIKQVLLRGGLKPMYKAKPYFKKRSC